MNCPIKKRLLLLFSLCCLAGPHPWARAQSAASRPEEVEWTWEVRPSHIDPKLPNVLLVGDSITRNYFPEVQSQLASVANVYLFASSTSIGDPRLIRQLDEFALIENVPFKVVHFNNGMHGWNYSENEFKNAFPSVLHELHTIAPDASPIWATITPVRADKSPGPTNARIDARNSIALSFVTKAEIPIDNQHELMTHHADQYQDDVHFNPTGASIQGKQVAEYVRAALMRTRMSRAE